MTGHLLRTLLDLGHATSQNLEFSYRDGAISFGEETITEMNLLELRRRHPDQVSICSFPRAVESVRTGADWEWHLIGLQYTFKMRVQAKRVSKRGSIRSINRQAGTSPDTQINLLISDAEKSNFFPVYIFYCTKSQQEFWKPDQIRGVNPFETGCLLADAWTVRKKMPTKLSSIEKFAVPWHYLWSRRSFEFSNALIENDEYYGTADIVRSSASASTSYQQAHNFPTVTELNGEMGNLSDQPGIFLSEEAGQAAYSDTGETERGTSLLVKIDVREPDRLLRQFEPRTSEGG